MQQRANNRYDARLKRVTDYIYENLDQDIDLLHLAEIACMSPFHWHRIYQAVYGETIAATVRRLRLARAAADLTNTDKPVQEVAKRAGFHNIQSFTRLFKKHYGIPPAKYRQCGTHALFSIPFEEMDGMIPMLEAFAAFVLMGIGLLILLFRKQAPQTSFPECIRCGYNLTGNISGICPECGEKI